MGKSTTEALYLSLEQTFFFHGLPWSLQDTSVQMQLCDATPHTGGGAVVGSMSVRDLRDARDGNMTQVQSSS